MNYWQFKFNMKKGEWKEFKTITSGETFEQSINAYKKMQGCKGDIVFYYQTDKSFGRGIHFITEIISEPYREEYNTDYAIKLKVIKRFDPIYNDNLNKTYTKLQEKLNPMGQGASKYLFKNEDNGEALYTVLMQSSVKVFTKDIEVDNAILEQTRKLKEKYIDDGYLFNAFHNMNLIRGEVKHLSFIGNLLNPYGNHFKGNLFLKYFIQSLLEYSDLEDNNILKNFITDNPNLTLEKAIKDKNDDNIGRIDLWLESDNYIIAIEGKIEAKDNKGQLAKYNKYLENQDKKYLLLYLTLRKDEKPINVEQGELVNFHLMNFEQDILDFIHNSLDDENIKDYIQSTLLDYKDALIKYMYNYHLSFEYSHALIQKMTKNKNIFEKFQQIKEYYYQNIEECKNTVIGDIAENFEYAKSNIERLFFMNLKSEILHDENTSLVIESNMELDNDYIAKDISDINKIRRKRLHPKKENLGNLYINVLFDDDDRYFSIKNNYYGLFKDHIDCDDIFKLIEDFPESQKIASNVFKSDNISKLLNKKYRTKLIQKILKDTI